MSLLAQSEPAQDPASQACTDDEQADLKCGEESTDDDYSDSDEAEEDYGVRQPKASVKDILEATLQDIQDGTKDLTRPGQFVDLAANTGDPRQPTALHIMAAMDKKKLPKFDSKMERLIRFLTEHPEDLSKIQDKSGNTPLLLAIDTRKEKMVQWMCSAHPSISTILSIANNDKMNCLHVGVERKVKFLELLVNRADPATLASKDADGNTPLHLAVEYKRCREGQLSLVELIVAKSDSVALNGSLGGDFNDAGLSPYLHHKDSVRKAENKERDKNKKMAKDTKDREKDREKGSSRNHQDTGNVDGIHVSETPGQRQGQPLPPGHSGTSGVPTPDVGRGHDKRLVLQKPSQAKYGRGLQPVSAGANSPVVSRIPPFLDVDDGKKIPRPMDSTTKGNSDTKSIADSTQKSKVDKSTVKGVDHFLKLHYLRSRSYNAVMEILYGRNTTSDLELYFDLSGHGDLTQRGLENLLSKLKFEDILQYVAIPQISVELNTPNTANMRKSRTGASRTSKSDGAGRRDLCYIFDRLRKKGVKTVLKVIIDDLALPAHSDEAIEECLNLLGVIIWDWKKTDLCSEVIFKVAPRVREAHLYWSGNNAVLRGWSEEGGLKRLSHLRIVHLHVQQGLESTERTQQNVDQFYERMKEQCPQVTIFREGPIIQRSLTDAVAVRAEREHSTKHEWIQCMKEFRKLLFDAERYHDSQKIEDSIEEPIRIAIIDDGVDVKDLEYTFIGGRTFCTRDEEHNLNNPYYVSSTGHGTIMAKQVHLLCPRAQFYVLRLEDHHLDEAGRQITAKSATQAILAAVRKGVHIISMSWTIDPPEDEEERRSLEAAIVKAANENILMFCSASDKGAKQNTTYPAKATSRIFTIGAATASGAADEWVGNLSNINFTFPGSKVELDDAPDSTGATPKEVTGSSVATALAAGLAALILYCAQVRVLLASDQAKLKARRDFQALKKHENMMRAFKDIGTTEPSNHKFIEVWEVFGKMVQDKERYDQEKWIELIAEVGTTLCRKF
ncbi:hypothetical protein QQS21_006573 [Conoideocrella luteorostrata]|uniref:Peptidase S8/S53 domain-containing protein n=1 Tax=Conoideocrella luteorostrata TaxID=1105319 RepID=A0AAJ0CMJ2_9HYPO|nr:hypothetical protein QQS21_006573 [Conoideocrella luteorostrata]